MSKKIASSPVEIKSLQGQVLYVSDVPNNIGQAKRFSYALSEAVEGGIDLTGANLSNRSFVDVYLRGASLAGAHFKHADFTGARIVECNFSCVDASNAVFDKTMIRDLSAPRAKLNHASFRNAVIEDSAFRDASLEGIQDTDSVWRKTDFTRANLSGAHLWGSSFSDCVFDFANLNHLGTEGTRLSKVRVYGAQMKRVDLSRIDLVETDFTDSMLSCGAVVLSKDAVFKVGPIGLGGNSRMLTLIKSDQGLVISDGGDCFSSFAAFKHRLVADAGAGEVEFCSSLLDMIEQYAQSCALSDRPWFRTEVLPKP